MADRDPSRRSFMIDALTAVAGFWVAATSGTVLGSLLGGCENSTGPTPIVPPGPAPTDPGVPPSPTAVQPPPDPTQIATNPGPGPGPAPTPTMTEQPPPDPYPGPVVKYGGPPGPLPPGPGPAPTPMYGGVYPPTPNPVAPPINRPKYGGPRPIQTKYGGPSSGF
jgi:hypothetical protein